MSGESDTIVALSSAPAPALRGIIRVSGPRSREAVEAFCTVLGGRSRRIPAILRIPGWNAEVECVVHWMKAPRSYTGEDMVEIHTYGCLPLLNRCVEQIADSGARLAQPGEFTRRAFLAGKIDLAQAEAVQALIAASSEAERRAAFLGMTGELSARLRRVDELLLEAASLLEACLDFAEEEIDSEVEDLVEARLAECLKTLAGLSVERGAAQGAILHVCICGLPNAGKSTLFNALLQTDAALTSPVAGTTLDCIEGDAAWGGASFRLVDTPGAGEAGSAGVHEDPASVRSRAQERMREVAQGADLILHLIDGSAPFERERHAWLESFPSVPRLIVKTKCDLPSLWQGALGQDAPMVEISCREASGLDAVREWIGHQARKCSGNREPALLNLRQRCAASAAAEHISRALGSLRAVSLEFSALDVRSALESMGELFGQTAPDEILDRIFSRFCIGK